MFLNIDEVKFLRDAARLRGTEAAPVRMNVVPGSVESDWDLTGARMDSCVAGGYFAARGMEVKNPGFSVLEGFAEACYL